VVALWFGQEFDKISNSRPFCGPSINDKRGLGDRRAILITGSETIQEYFFERSCKYCCETENWNLNLVI
jgi:hypothetical protein